MAKITEFSLQILRDIIFLTFFFKLSTSMEPSDKTGTSSISIPAILADAGFVPWADIGIRQIFR